MLKSGLERKRVARFKDETVNIFITGGTTGIGLELAILYLKEGHRVGICARDLTKFPEEIKNKFKLLKTYQVDVTDREALRDAVRNFAGPEEILDVMVANAGRSVGSKTKLPDFKAARDIVEINIVGVLNAFDVACELMIPKNQGHLVATSSVAGMVGLPGAAAYSASKAYVSTLCESFALDLEKFGIHVTAILPGFVDTPLTKKNNHKMPFMMSADKAAGLIKNAIDKKKAVFIFPLPMKIVMTLFKVMPRRFYRRLMKLKVFNYSKH